MLGRLGLEPPVLSDVEFERIEELAGLADCARGSPSCSRIAGGVARRAAPAVLEERPYPEVAAALGIAEPAVRARVSRALRGLAAELEGERNAA